MKILNILTDGPTNLSTKMIEVHRKDNEVKVIDLSKNEVSYESIVGEIESADKVISW